MPCIYLNVTFFVDITFFVERITHIKEALVATGFDSLQDWCFHMLDPDHDCDLVGVIGLRKLTNVIFHFV